MFFTKDKNDGHNQDWNILELSRFVQTTEREDIPIDENEISFFVNLDVLLV